MGGDKSATWPAPTTRKIATDEKSGACERKLTEKLGNREHTDE